MLEAMGEYIRTVWQSTLMTRLMHALLVALVFEGLILLSKAQIKKAFKKVMARDLNTEGAMRVLRRRIVVGVPQAIVQAVLMIIAFLVIFRYLGFDLKSEIMPVGGLLVVAGLVIFRNVLADAAAGYFILYEDLFGIGDRITVSDTTGTVVSMGLRSTRLLTNDGREITLGNSLMREIVNHTRVASSEKASRGG